MLDLGLLIAHAAATTLLAGIVWTVQLVVYPAFAAVGPSPAWRRYHREHSRRMTTAIALPWAVQGACLAALLWRRPAGVPLGLLLAAAVLGLATVVVTIAVSLPQHSLLGTAYDEAAALRLLRTNWLRVLAWGCGAACALAMLVLHTLSR